MARCLGDQDEDEDEHEDEDKDEDKDEVEVEVEVHDHVHDHVDDHVDAVPRCCGYAFKAALSRIFSQRSGNGIPRPAAIFGTSDVAVMPGSVLISRM